MDDANFGKTGLRVSAEQLARLDQVNSPDAPPLARATVRPVAVPNP